VQLPYELEWNSDQDHGKILDANGRGTGFTYVDQPTNGTGYIPQNLTVNTAGSGTLDIKATKGTALTTANKQNNALGVGIDAPNHETFTLKTTVLNPTAGAGKKGQAGLWFGSDEDNYDKLVITDTTAGLKIQHLIETNGTVSQKKTTSALTLTDTDKIFLSLRAKPIDGTITATWRINDGPLRTLSTNSAPPEFFSFDAAGIDPRIGTRSFGGILTNFGFGTTAPVYKFDNFAALEEQTGPPPPSNDGNFARSSFELPFPSSMVWGPDNRLYVTEMFGKIHAITLNDAKQVVNDEVITTLGQRLTLGITVDPQSTASNVILWVSHSDPSTSAGELNSSTVTRLSGPGFTNRQDVITGLPRAFANHAVNSIHFGPGGKLYIAQGGNTGAGAANQGNTEFGTRAEQPLSAALLVADVNAAGFDGSCATPENSFGPSPCDVVPYATGFRNMYDFVFHSNGSLYGPDNGLGVDGTYPPTPTPPCADFGDIALHDPGEQPDILNRIEQGKYYGHPNPYRNECVFKDGSLQGVSPLPNYVPPIRNLGAHTSSNGTIEYTSNAALGGALKGELLIANYSVGDDITRIELSADGRSVASAQRLAGGFNNPLPLAQGPDGTIYVGEFGGNLITSLKPTSSSTPPSLGSWTTKQPMPVAVLDAGGGAVGGKLYAVAGKTSAGPRTTLYAYDPGTDSWSTGPNLPGPAVENPAVTELDGKLYAFGGSAKAFSGAVTNAAVFDPATSTWQTLAPMPTARGGAAAEAINGKIYVVGGMDGSGASLASVAVYDPATNTWSTAAPMSTRRDNPGSAVLGGKLYVFGGRTRNADGTASPSRLATVEMYDPATNTWTARASMPTARRTMVVGTINGRAQVMGGERGSNNTTFPQNEEYDPTTDTWRTLEPMVTPRHGAAGGTINGVVYVAGGGPTGGSSYTDVNEAFSFPP
jgi:glucose/arabinose dehydrogenase/N-acetylneuraminic acid mutarotase